MRVINACQFIKCMGGDNNVHMHLPQPTAPLTRTNTHTHAYIYTYILPASLFECT